MGRDRWRPTRLGCASKSEDRGGLDDETTRVGRFRTHTKNGPKGVDTSEGPGVTTPSCGEHTGLVGNPEGVSRTHRKGGGGGDSEETRVEWTAQYSKPRVV